MDLLERKGFLERVRSFHRGTLLVCAVLLVAGSLAGVYVAFFRRSSDLPGFVYALAGLRSSPGGLSSPAKPGPRFGPPPGPELVRWRPWGAAALQEARSSDKLVLLDLTAWWCRPCALMDEQTYRNPAVADWIAKNVVPVRVDSALHPELVLRYLSGGWPTTSLLLPTGEVLSSGTFIPPGSFLPWARQVAQGYRQGKAEVMRQRRKVRREAEEGHRLRLRVAPANRAMLDQGAEELRWNLSRNFDAREGGFGSGAKFPSSEPIRFLLALEEEAPHPEVERMLRRTLEAEQRLMDPVWGGAFRYSTTPDWKSPSTEKLLSVQADLLRDYALAYSLTKESRDRAAARRLEAYLQRFLGDPEGGFYGSQNADLVRADGSRLAGRDYYALPERRRLELGIPPVDRRRPADSNAKAALGLLEAALAFSDAEAEAAALRALDRLWSTADAEGALPHLSSGDSPRGLAEDEVLAAQAMLAAYLATGQPRFYARTKLLWRYIRARLEVNGKPPLMESPAPPEGLEWSLSPYATALAWELAASLGDLAAEPEYVSQAEALFAWCATQSGLLDPLVMGRLVVRERAKPVVVFLAGARSGWEKQIQAFEKLPSPRKYLVTAEARAFKQSRR